MEEAYTIPSAAQSDDKLKAVAHAIDRLTGSVRRVATGERAMFPPVGLALVGDEEDLSIPLRENDVRRIARRASGSSEDRHVEASDGCTVSIPAKELVQRNHAWSEFLSELVEAVRDQLRIPQGTCIHTSFRRLVLHRSGDSRVHQAHESARANDEGNDRFVIGKLLVVLPGKFEGGSIVVAQPNHSETNWDPGAMSEFSIKFAAYLNICAVTASPVTFGMRLSLEYDIVGDAPYPAGVQMLRSAVVESLEGFFDTTSTSRKRRRIETAEWLRKEETSRRRLFVHVTQRVEEFNELSGNDLSVAQCLEIFCNCHVGEYNLYLATLGILSNHDESSSERMSAMLLGPWMQLGVKKYVDISSYDVNVQREVLPLGILDRPSATVDSLYRSMSALVVLPRATELLSLAAAPDIDHAAHGFEELVKTGPRDVAVAFARQVLATKREWTTTRKAFVKFLRSAVELNDVDVFIALLQNPGRHEFQPELGQAMVHFRWRDCMPAVQSIIQKLPVRSRVRFVCSMLEGCADRKNIDDVLFAVASHSPWTDRELIDSGVESSPNIDDLSVLLGHAHRSSLRRLATMLDTDNDEFVYDQLVPALSDLFWELPAHERPPLVKLLKALKTKIKLWLPAIRNAPFAECRVRLHCAPCAQLQHFLSSTASDVILTCSVTSRGSLRNCPSAKGRSSSRLSDPPSLSSRKSTSGTFRSRARS